MPDIFTYLDYHKFLEEYYLEQKRLFSQFSYQLFANRAGLKSKTYLYRIIKGERHISRNVMLSVISAMKLESAEADYFEAMVLFKHAQSESQRENYLRRMQTIGRDHHPSCLNVEQYAYFSKWYLPVLREVVTYFDFGEDYSALAGLFQPPIREDLAKEGVALLTSLGLIRCIDGGRYEQTTSSLTTGDQLKSLAIRSFQRDCLRLACDALGYSVKKRDISNMTVGISEEGFLKIRKETALYRKRIAAICENDKKIDRVYSVNIQVFPLTKV